MNTIEPTILSESGLMEVRGVNHYYEWIRQTENSPEKPVMVFIHGWGGSARYWRSTAQALSNQYNCLLYDLRGFGRSKLIESSLELSYELEEYAEDLAQLLEALKIDKIDLHSHSMGASIAVYFLNLYPQKINKAILTCNGIFDYDEKAFETFYKFGGYVVKFRYQWFLNVPFAEELFMQRFLHKSIDKTEKRAFLEDYLLADYQAAMGTIFTSVSKKAVAVMPQKFAEISVPTLLIAGEKDQIIPANLGRKAAQLNQNIEYVEISNTGHFPMLEDPENYLENVRKFI